VRRFHGARAAAEAYDARRTALPLVLLVEDEEVLREPLAHLLRLRHYDVVAADTAESALDLLRAYPPDAAIIDLHLKHGSGRDVIVRRATTLTPPPGSTARTILTSSRTPSSEPRL